MSARGHRHRRRVDDHELYRKRYPNTARGAVPGPRLAGLTATTADDSLPSIRLPKSENCAIRFLMIKIDDSLFALPAAPAPERRGERGEDFWRAAGKSSTTSSRLAGVIASAAKQSRGSRALDALKSAQHLEKVQSAEGSPIWFSLFSAWISDQFPWISLRPPLNL
jgi:hypothetical protein